MFRNTFIGFSQIVKEVWSSDLKILVVILLAPLLQLFIKLLVPVLMRFFILGLAGFKKGDKNTEKRVKTLAGVIEATTLVLIAVGVVFFVFSELNINMAPVITGAGILGLAVGFGAQSMVKDVIAGIFIVLENQYNKGDWIKVGNFEGKVVEVNLRRTVLQTTKGARHIIPNGKIEIVTNNTNQFSIVSLDIPAKIGIEFDKVNKLIDKVGQELMRDPKFKEDIIEAPETVGVNEINEYAAVIRVWGKVKSGKQIKIKRELAGRIVKEFAKNNIQLPGKIVS